MSIRRRPPRLRAWLGQIAILLASGCAWIANGPPPPPDPEGAVRTGYAVQDRSSVTGAISSVSEESLENVRVSQMGELLWGRVPGLDVSRRGDGSYSLRIRGVSSMISNVEPLVVVDGVALGTSRDLWSINPMDVARVDVLKDASSTAIYGSRGANGVVIITTKRAR